MDAIKSLWKDKPLFITVCVALVGIIYILWKNNNANVTAPTSTVAPTTTAAGSVAPGTFVESSYYNNSPTTTTTTITNPIATPPVTAPPNNPTQPTPPPTKPAQPYQGLLGAGVRIFPQADGTLKYRGPKTGGKIIPVPLPKGTVFGPGGGGRYYYRLPGSNATALLTIG